MGVSGGGIEKLAALASKLEMLGRSDEFKRKLMKQLSVECLNRVAECFISQRDPYGHPWKPVKFEGRRKGGQILRDTGRLMNGFRALATADNFRVTNRTEYAAIHQYGGTFGRAARQVIRGSNGREIGARKKISATRRVTVGSVAGGQTVMPARPFLPKQRALPATWAKAFNAIADTMLRKQLGAH